MEKYKVKDLRRIEKGEIWIWELNSADNIGIIFIVPYLNENFKNLYPIGTNTNDIINDLLDKAGLNNCTTELIP